jgi:hypothetical protein
VVVVVSCCVFCSNGCDDDAGDVTCAVGCGCGCDVAGCWTALALPLPQVPVAIDDEAIATLQSTGLNLREDAAPSGRRAPRCCCCCGRGAATPTAAGASPP